MNIKFWLQESPDSSCGLTACNKRDPYASKADEPVMNASAVAQQPSAALCRWDLISLQENARLLREVADDIDAILRKAALINQS